MASAIQNGQVVDLVFKCVRLFILSVVWFSGHHCGNQSKCTPINPTEDSCYLCIICVCMCLYVHVCRVTVRVDVHYMLPGKLGLSPTRLDVARALR